MIARRPLPPTYEEWNSTHHAPWGRPGTGLARRLGRNLLVARYVGPYGWQGNTSTRAFEYPWVFERIAELGGRQRIVDVGASLAGMQFTLASGGHDVHAVDPGMNATGKGWDVDPDTHALLRRAYRAPVTLHPTTLPEAGIDEKSVDTVLSVSSIEHFSEPDLTSFADTANRLLKPGGHVVLTIDLFLDLAPFTSRPENPAGRNVDVRELLERIGVELVVGERSELNGYPEFDADRVQSNLPDYFVGAGTYPTMSQCVVGRLQ